MRSYVSNVLGRQLVLHLQKGEDVLESITAAARDLGIRTAIVTSCVGSLRQAVYHRVQTLDDDAQNAFFTISKPIEIGAVQGMIIDGVPHLHISFADLDRAYCGHMEPGCEVLYLVEVSILELQDADYVRRTDDHGITFIDRR